MKVINLLYSLVFLAAILAIVWQARLFFGWR